VDPILPAISHELNASPSEVTLLFTSYLMVTAVAMLITNWVSSRLGAKKTLIAGLGLIVVFSALAGASPTISGIIGFRAGWGVGNALFIATSLAVIVASASGGFAGFVRFVGGGLAPYVAGRLVVATNIHVPFFIAAGAVAAGIVILSAAHRLLAEAERVQAEQVSGTTSASVGPTGTRAAPARIPVTSNAVSPARSADVILAATDSSPMAALVAAGQAPGPVHSCRSDQFHQSAGSHSRSWPRSGCG
jgi:MFS family permease